MTLTNDETIALSFVLKFATGIRGADTTDTVMKNYRFGDSDFTKGFIQGIIYASHTTVDEPSLPRRYLSALQELSKRRDIHISPADKGGGIVIQNLTDYNSKMENLLQDTTNYEPVSLNTINTATDLFTRETQKLLKNEDRGQLTQLPPKNPQNVRSPKNSQAWSTT